MSGYQDLTKRHELPEPGKLPPVFPVVLYNGAKPWRAAKSLADLIVAAPADPMSDLAIELGKWRGKAVPDSLQRDQGQWRARHLRWLARRRIIKSNNSIGELAAMSSTPEFKTFGDIFRYEAQLYGDQERVKKLLVKRFGTVPAKFIKRVDNAEMNDLDRWSDRLFDARRIQDIFAEDQPA